jgi:hypothetical protein
VELLRDFGQEVSGSLSCLKRDSGGGLGSRLMGKWWVARGRWMWSMW